MMISDLELAELKSRTANVIRTGSALANVQEHIRALEVRVGKSRLPRTQSGITPAKYLYQLIILAESLGSEVPSPDLVEVSTTEPVIVTSVELSKEGSAPIPEETTSEPKEKGHKREKKEKKKS